MKNKIQYKSIENNGDVLIKGYASVFGEVDSYNDIVTCEAFSKALNASSDSVKFLWQHDAANPIGRIEKMTADSYGLYIEAKITNGTKQGQEAIDLVKKGIIDGLSIGYNVVESSVDPQNRRMLLDIDLWEVSLVTFPANGKARLITSSNNNKNNNQNNNQNNKEEKMNNFMELGIEEEFEVKDGLSSFIKGRGSELEHKSFSADQQDMGGYAVTSEKFKSIIGEMVDLCPMRQIASQDTISTNALDLLIQDGEFESGWVAEREARGDSEGSKIRQKRISVHEIYAQPKATQRLLDDSYVNIEQWITGQLTHSFAKKENAAFINGDGNNKPCGILRCEEIEKIDVATPSQITADDILDLINSLGEIYQANAAFLMNRRVFASIQSLKDANGRFLIQQSITEKAPNTLFGIPVYFSAEMPDYEEGSCAIALGDFKAGYKIVDRHGIAIMKDPYTEKPFIKFYATKRVGGDVVDSKAIKLLKM